jgi:MinD superfamily P-loop ATPase
MIISIASGKGGTGKTLVATSLAVSIKNSTHLQFLDCDAEEPNAHIFLKPDIERTEKVSIPVPQIDDAKCIRCGRCAEVCAYNAIAVTKDIVMVFPELCHGCGACSCLCPEMVITETPREIGIIESGRAGSIEFIRGKLSVGEALVPPVIRKVRQKVKYDSTVIIDAPPGTSCPVVESIRGSGFCLLITEPTPFGLNDLALAVATVRELKVPCGVVINRAGTGDNKIEEYCLQENLPVLLSIPLDMEIARLYSRGITLADGLPEWQEKFIGLFEKIAEIVNERSRSFKR